MAKGVLAGIRVVEYDSYAASNNVGKILALWGAEVIKVEPLSGDVFRVMGQNNNVPIGDEENPAFQLVASNKKSVTLDTKSAEGRELLFKLLGTADVFLTNVRMPSLVKNHLAWEDIHEKFPKIVYCHVSGWGLKGPQSGDPGFDTVCYWGVSGAMVDLAPAGGPPLPPSFGVGDQHIGAYGAGGIAGALYKREKTGDGSFVSVSLMGVSALGHGMMTTFCQNAFRDRGLGEKYPRGHYDCSLPTFNTYKCKDGEWLMLTVNEHTRLFPRFCKTFGIPEEIYTQPRFADEKQIHERENMEAMVNIIDEVMLKYTSDEALQMMKDVDLVAAKYAHFSDFAVNEQAHINGYFEYFTSANGQAASYPANPVIFNDGEDNLHLTGFPKLGEHNEEIYTAIGCTAEQLQELRDKKII